MGSWDGVNKKIVTITGGTWIVTKKNIQKNILKNQVVFKMDFKLF